MYQNNYLKTKLKINIYFNYIINTMYHPARIAPLSASQISKALKGLPVRVSVGNQHDVELSAQQFKNLSKAHQKGKASTITMDPYQIQNHMHLLGAGKLKKKY